MVKRILFTLLCLCSIFTMPIYVTGLLLLIGLVLFKNYFEAVAVVLVYESVFAPRASNHFFIGVAICFIILCIVEYIRPYVRK